MDIPVVQAELSRWEHDLLQLSFHFQSYLCWRMGCRNPPLAALFDVFCFGTYAQLSSVCHEVHFLMTFPSDQHQVPNLPTPITGSLNKKKFIHSLTLRRCWTSSAKNAHSLHHGFFEGLCSLLRLPLILIHDIFLSRDSLLPTFKVNAVSLTSARLRICVLIACSLCYSRAKSISKCAVTFAACKYLTLSYRLSNSVTVEYVSCRDPDSSQLNVSLNCQP